MARGSATTANNGAGTTSVVVAVPATKQTGDVVVAEVTVRGGSGTTITAPAGWTAVDLAGNGNAQGTQVRDAVYWHVVAGGDPTNYTWTFNSSQAASGAMAAYGGVDPTTPVDASRYDHLGRLSPASRSELHRCQ